MSTTINADTSISDVSPAIANAAVNVAALPEADPCTVVIFGASGDLAKRKLLPALFNLACAGSLQCKRNQFTVLGIGRTPMTDDEFRNSMHEFMLKAKDVADFTEEGWKEFASRIYYMVGDPNDNGSHEELAVQIEALANEHGASRNCLFYLSTPPSATATIIKGLGSANLNDETNGWRRVIIEKPFGRDLTSARELNAVVGGVFQEHQTYRIDHYLGKETVQNILVFRFGNSIFEPIWNRNFIDHVQITVAEKLGVGSRGGYYDTAGALRDMIPNHIFQLITLTAMEPPVSFEADAVRDEQAKILQAIQPFAPEDVLHNAVRGQYGAGEIDKKNIQAYRSESNVAPESNTETYAALKLSIDNWRWADVPFYIRTGKHLPAKRTDITIQFKKAPFMLFRNTTIEKLTTNRLVIHVQPDEGITLHFGAKVPGPIVNMGVVDMDFNYVDHFGEQISTGYERLLFDCMTGDATLFQRADMVESSWEIVSPILDVWQAIPARDFPNYEAGSWGTDEADELLSRDGRKWKNTID